MLLVGLLRARRSIRTAVVPVLTLVALGATAGLAIWQWDDNASIVAGALRDRRPDARADMVFVGRRRSRRCCCRGARWRRARPAHGEYHALLLTVGARHGRARRRRRTWSTLFLGLELLSIPLYVLCATEMRREHSLESGLKYLIIGSVGSATLLYGLALRLRRDRLDRLRGDRATRCSVGDGSRRRAVPHRHRAGRRGLAFKASVAPFHQWTPDVYEGAPTPVTAFMAVATKAAAFGVILRFFDVALIDAHDDLGAGAGGARRDHDRGRQRRRARPVVAEADARLLVGRAGRLHARRRRRRQRGSGVQATVFYLAVYLVMNMAAFAVIVARERETGLGDDISRARRARRRAARWLAWPMTIAMLALAGFPATAGFIGKFYLIDAAVDGGYTWLGVVIVIGSMISLAYYLRVVAAVWMRSPARRPRRRLARRRGAPGDRRRLAGGRRGGPRRRPRAGRRCRRRAAARAAGRSCSWRSCAPRRRCSSGSIRRRCSTSRGMRARR